MIFMGFLLLFDHPKKDVLNTLKDIKRNGVSLRIISGDNKLIALHTANAVGLEVSGILRGSELASLSEEELLNKIESTTIFAEVDPNQKERIIFALKKKNHIVGYMGDGINDVPALHVQRDQRRQDLRRALARGVVDKRRGRFPLSDLSSVRAVFEG